MSDENRLQTEEELWEVLNEPVVVEGKSKSAPKRKPLPKPVPKPKRTPDPVPAPAPVPEAKPKPKTEGRFARTGDAEFKAEEPQAPAAPAAVPVAAGKKFDGFFFACMAGVAAVSVALTLIVSSMAGGEKPSDPIQTDPGISGEVIATDGPIETDPGLSQEIARLELENAELQAQLAVQQQQISTLQAELMTLKGGDGSLSSAPSGGSDTGTEATDAQVEAYTIFNQIKDAYANFDRAKLEELIPQMDKRLTYLSSSDLNEYYLILEYVEQPSNG